MKRWLWRVPALFVMSLIAVVLGVRLYRETAPYFQLSADTVPAMEALLQTDTGAETLTIFAVEELPGCRIVGFQAAPEGRDMGYAVFRKNAAGRWVRETLRQFGVREYAGHQWKDSATGMRYEIELVNDGKCAGAQIEDGNGGTEYVSVDGGPKMLVLPLIEGEQKIVFFDENKTVLKQICYRFTDGNGKGTLSSGEGTEDGTAFPVCGSE